MTASINYSWDWPHTKKWPRFNGKKIDIIKKLFLAGESLNVDNFIRFFADECYYQFANFPPSLSPQQIADSSKGFIDTCEGLHHHIVNAWEPNEETIVIELDVTYISHSGKVVTLPCCDIITLEAEKIKTMKIFMDITPLIKA
jgi:hypothetical protein